MRPQSLCGSIATPHRSDRQVVLVIELDQLQSCKPKHIGVVENLR